MMRPVTFTVALITLAAIAACTPSKRQPSASEIQQAALARSQKDTVANQLAQSVAFIAAPLRTLTQEQQASLAALLIITRAAAEEQILHPTRGGALEAVWPRIEEICPPLRGVALSRGGCIDADIAYASAMARCQGEGKSDDECEREAAPEAAAAVACHMKALRDLPGVIRGLPGRTWPPRPIPWPYEPARSAPGARG